MLFCVCCLDSPEPLQLIGAGGGESGRASAGGAAAGSAGAGGEPKGDAASGGFGLGGKGGMTGGGGGGGYYGGGEFERCKPLFCVCALPCPPASDAFACPPLQLGAKVTQPMQAAEEAAVLHVARMRRNNSLICSSVNLVDQRLTKMVI